MAVALGKLILPICYSESFYKMDDRVLDIERTRKGKKQHIGCYPWRKQLFEYYGIRYRTSTKKATKYEDFSYAIDMDRKFADIQYNRFPYHEVINGGRTSIGRQIYDRLKNEYNNAGPEGNTLVVYNLDGFMNEEEAGKCIVNFYRSITVRMRLEQCFCGERVGILARDDIIPEDQKDASDHMYLRYRVGEVIQIGVNQATYQALEQKLKTDDVLKEPDILDNKTNEKEQKKKDEKERKKEEQKEAIKRFVKEHIGNRGMIIYPNNPVCVSRVKNRLQENILDNLSLDPKEGCKCCKTDAFCLYHVMLKNLKYTNEVVVDVTDNSLQNLFWLGAAHGSGINAITVLHEKTDREMEISSSASGQRSRNVFDIAGLWTAIFQTKDTEGFYHQLALAQYGIESHSKLMAAKDSDSENDDEKKRRLESYYRKCFWNPMLRYNRLNIYLVKKNDKEQEDSEPRIRVAKWDFDAVSELSHYLSKRTVIGEYSIKSLPENGKDRRGEETNFICIGSAAKPLGNDLSTYIKSVCRYFNIAKSNNKENIRKLYGENVNVIHIWEVVAKKETFPFVKLRKKQACRGKYVYKGFAMMGKLDGGLYTQHSQSQCTSCPKYKARSKDEEILFYKRSKLVNSSNACTLKKRASHIELAQLILWRENAGKKYERNYFRVGINGSSGPATLGLSLLFVDEEQKKGQLKGQENNVYLLNELQEAARKKFMEIFLTSLQKKLEMEGLVDRNRKDEKKEQYFSLVKHAASYYLSTVLYRYFLPFLSEKDIERIHNGMYMFVHSMKAANASPFALNEKYDKWGIPDKCVADAIKLVPEVLLTVLKGFRGMEVFYQVQVEGSTKAEGSLVSDTRIVKEIEMLKDEKNKEKIFINYFFLPEWEGKKEKEWRGEGNDELYRKNKRMVWKKIFQCKSV